MRVRIESHPLVSAGGGVWGGMGISSRTLKSLVYSLHITWAHLRVSFKSPLDYLNHL